jgi:hypothetical protein
VLIYEANKNLSPQELYEQTEGLSDDEKLEIFKEELDSLDQKEGRKLLRKILLNLPEYFWFANQPDEYSKNYPMIQTNGGIIRHTKRRFEILQTLIETYDSNPTLEDILKISCIIADGFVYGKRNNIPEEEDPHRFHALIIRNMIEENNWDLMIPQAVYSGILDCVESHQGSWAPSGKLKPKLGQPEHLLHQADYLINSKRVI